MPEGGGPGTPHPPATAEFGHVVQGGPAHQYQASAGGPEVVKFSVGQYDNNVYLIASRGQALVVDGAAEPGRILHEASSRGLTVTSILQTHNHFDHTGALRELVEALDVPVLAHPEDPMPVPTDPLSSGRVEVGGLGVEVLHTPGHTPGSLCYLIDGFLFSGDTLFPGGPGNTRGQRSAHQRIMRSLDELFSLPDVTRVCPGHGLDTTIGRERPHLQSWRARGW